jgi:hypothetical protein
MSAGVAGLWCAAALGSPGHVLSHAHVSRRLRLAPLKMVQAPGCVSSVCDFTVAVALATCALLVTGLHSATPQHRSLQTGVLHLRVAVSWGILGAPRLAGCRPPVNCSPCGADLACRVYMGSERAARVGGTGNPGMACAITPSSRLCGCLTTLLGSATARRGLCARRRDWGLALACAASRTRRARVSPAARGACAVGLYRE